MTPHERRGDELPETQPARALVWLWRTLHVAARRFDRDSGYEKASSLAYSSLLAIVPAALLALSILELLNPQAQIETTNDLLQVLFPPEAAAVRDGFRDYILESRAIFSDPASAGTLRILSLLVLVYFAGKLLQEVDRVVGAVWGGRSFRRFLRRLSAYWAVVTLGPLLLALSFVATGMAGEVLGETAGGVVARVVPFAVTWCAVFLFFRLMPHSPVRTSAAFAGAVVTGTLWESSKLALGWYFGQPKTLLTTLSFFPAALLWMYVSWAICVFGLEVAYVVHHRSWRGGAKALLGPRHGAARETLAVAVLVEIALAFDRGESPDRMDVAERVGAAEDEVADVLGDLGRAGFVAMEHAGWRLARGADGIAVTDVLAAVRGRPDAAPLRERAGSSRAALAAMSRIAASQFEGCGDLTIAALARDARTLGEVPPAAEPAAGGEPAPAAQMRP